MSRPCARCFCQTPSLTVAEEGEACRALKGSMLRQEAYALDGSLKEPIPYIVTEQNCIRDPIDPRVQHALTLKCDPFGNVLKHAVITYGRREIIRAANAQGVSQHIPNPGLTALYPTDRGKQAAVLVTYKENGVTNPVESTDAHRTPLPCETRTFELTGYAPTGPAGRFQPSDLMEPDANVSDRLRSTFFGEAAYEDTAVGANQRRPIETKRTLYRSDNLAELLPLGTLESLAIAGESYALAFTPGLLTSVFQRPRATPPLEALLPNPADVLAGDRGGYVQSQVMKDDGRFPASDAGDEWWMPSGRSFASADPNDNATSVLSCCDGTCCRARSLLPPATAIAIRSVTTRSSPTTARVILQLPATISSSRAPLTHSRTVSSSSPWITARASATLGERRQRQPDGGRLRYARSCCRNGGDGEAIGGNFGRRFARGLQPGSDASSGRPVS